MWLRLNGLGFHASNRIQNSFLEETFLESWDEGEDEDVWMCRDILESNAPAMFRAWFDRDAEEEYTQASSDKYWGEVQYYCEYLIKRM